jgi:O-antigen ligase
MDPNIALVIFLGFIAGGFVFEKKGRDNHVTPAIWLPVFWMAICASRSISQWLSVSNYKVTYSSDADYVRANMSGSAVDRVVLTLIIVIGLAIIFKRGAIGPLIRRNQALVAFVFYLGLTVLWSEMGGVSFKRWVRLFGHVVMAGVVMSEPSPVQAVQTVFLRCAYLLLPLSVMLIKYFPGIGVLYFRKGEMLWIGAAVMKNGLGHLALVFTFVVTWMAVTGRGLRGFWKMPTVGYNLIVILLGLWLLRGNEGATSSAAIGSLTVAVVMLLGSRLSLVRAAFPRSGLFLIIGIVVFIAVETSFGVVELVVRALGRDMTFTDRVPLWSALIDLGMERALFGYGYSGFWTDDMVSVVAARAGEFNQGHNGYLEIFVEGGLVAIGLLLVLLVAVFRKIQQTGAVDYDYAVVRLCFFVIVLLGNVTESSFARERDLLTFVFFMIAINDSVPLLATAGVPAKAPSSRDVPAVAIKPRWNPSFAGGARRRALPPR